MTSDKCAASYIATIGCRFADLNDRDTEGMPTLKIMKTASRTLKRGRKTDGMPRCGWGEHVSDGERKMREKANVFYNLTTLWEERHLAAQGRMEGGREV